MFLYIPCHTAGKVENNVCTRVANCLCAHERVILVFISLVGNKHQNNTRVSAKTVRRKSTYIILFLTRHNVSKKWRLKRGSSHIIPVSHSLSLHSADDVTIDWWWRDNDQTIVTRTRDKWYLTPILFTAIFTAGRVRKPITFIYSLCLQLVLNGTLCILLVANISWSIRLWH